MNEGLGSAVLALRRWRPTLNLRALLPHSRCLPLRAGDGGGPGVPAARPGLRQTRRRRRRPDELTGLLSHLRSAPVGHGAVAPSSLVGLRAGQARALDPPIVEVALLANAAFGRFSASWLLGSRRQALNLLALCTAALRCLTCELSGHQRQGARPVRQMIDNTAARAWRLAVGAPLERGVRHQRGTT